MSTEEKNKALVCRFLEAQSTGDLEALDELLAPDFVDHGLLSGQEPRREGFMQGVTEAHATLSFIRTTIEYQGTDGNDMVITRHTTLTIHDRGAYLGIMTPTAQERETKGMLIHRVSEGKIVEEWSATSGAPVLEALTQEIRERERVERELEVARTVQQGSLPKGVPSLEEWQINPYCQPAKEVGGDFYEFYQLDDGRVGFAVGDVSGKGVPAAIVMAGIAAYLGGVAAASGASPGGPPGSGQRSAVRPHPTQHVRHLLPWHPRS
jgi:ketosteroid isomerase-like protein